MDLGFLRCAGAVEVAFIARLTHPTAPRAAVTVIETSRLSRLA